MGAVGWTQSGRGVVFGRGNKTRTFDVAPMMTYDERGFEEKN